MGISQNPAENFLKFLHPCVRGMSHLPDGAYQIRVAGQIPVHLRSGGAPFGDGHTTRVGPGAYRQRRTPCPHWQHSSPALCGPSCPPPHRRPRTRPAHTRQSRWRPINSWQGRVSPSVVTTPVREPLSPATRLWTWTPNRRGSWPVTASASRGRNPAAGFPQRPGNPSGDGAPAGSRSGSLAAGRWPHSRWRYRQCR